MMRIRVLLPVLLTLALAVGLSAGFVWLVTQPGATAPAAEAVEPEAEPAVWSWLADGTLGTAVGPDGRVWRWAGVHGMSPDESSVRRGLVEAFDEASPRLDGGRVYGFGPGEWVWATWGSGHVMLGYDGERFVRREAIGKQHHMDAFINPSSGASPRQNEPAGMFTIGESAFFATSVGVHRFDGRAWSYQRLMPEGLQASNWSYVVPVPVAMPGGSMGWRVVSWTFAGNRGREAMSMHRWSGEAWERIGPGESRIVGAGRPDVQGIAATPEAVWVCDDGGSVRRVAVGGEAEATFDWSASEVNRFGPFEFYRAWGAWQSPTGEPWLSVTGARHDDGREWVSAFLTRRADGSFGAVSAEPIEEDVFIGNATVQFGEDGRFWLRGSDTQPIRLIDPERADGVALAFDLPGGHRLDAVLPDGRLVVGGGGTPLGPVYTDMRSMGVLDPDGTVEPARVEAGFALQTPMYTNRLAIGPGGEVVTYDPRGTPHRLTDGGWVALPESSELAERNLRDLWLGRGGVVLGRQHEVWVVIDGEGVATARPDLEQLVAETPAELWAEAFGGLPSRRLAVGRNGWVWRYSRPEDNGGEALFRVHAGQAGWIDLAPQLEGLDYRYWPSEFEAVGDGSAVVVAHRDPPRGAFVAGVELGEGVEGGERDGDEDDDASPSVTVTDLGSFGRYAFPRRRTLMDSEGVVRLHGRRQRPREEQDELRVGPGLRIAVRPVVGEAVYVDSRDRVYYTSIDGQADGVFRVVWPGGSVDRVVVPGMGRDALIGERPDGAIVMADGPAVVAVGPADRPGGAWRVGEPRLIGNLEGAMMHRRMTPRGRLLIGTSSEAQSRRLREHVGGGPQARLYVVDP